MVRWIAGLLASLLICSVTAQGVAETLKGKVVSVEGHGSPACRLLFVESDATKSIVAFRVPDTGSDNSILAVAMMALSQNRSVLVSFIPGLTTGCGTEPRIEYLRVS